MSHRHKRNQLKKKEKGPKARTVVEAKCPACGGTDFLVNPEKILCKKCRTAFKRPRGVDYIGPDGKPLRREMFCCLSCHRVFGRKRGQEAVTECLYCHSDKVAVPEKVFYCNDCKKLSGLAENGEDTGKCMMCGSSDTIKYKLKD